MKISSNLIGVLMLIVLANWAIDTTLEHWQYLVAAALLLLLFLFIVIFRAKNRQMSVEQHPEPRRSGGGFLGLADWERYHLARPAPPVKPPSDLDPYEFEEFCASKLRKRGWVTTTTKKSGDQGIDIVASKNGVKIAIQCKRYKGSVGNAAVQEVFAGRKYANAHHAAVITTGSYTNSARELASRCDVMLLTPHSLDQLDRFSARPPR